MSENVKSNDIKKANNANKTTSNSASTSKANVLDKYPTKRGFVGNLGKIVFLFLVKLMANMKATGTSNFPKQNPYVVASNHQSYADGVLIVKYLPKGHFKHMCCLAASDLETNHGWIGRLIMRVGRGIAVDRYGNPVRGLIKAKKEVEKGNICFVFPEGTRTPTGKLCEFKDGACYLAIKSNSPLVPVYIAGAYQIWSRYDKHPRPFKGFLKKKKIRIFVGKPMYGEQFNNDAHLMTEALEKWMHSIEDKYYDPETVNESEFKA